jgi:hypothetical protein
MHLTVVAPAVVADPEREGQCDGSGAIFWFR